MTSEHLADAPANASDTQAAVHLVSVQKTQTSDVSHVHDAGHGLDAGRINGSHGLMGILGDGPTDPKVQGRMLELRSEMLKAMGEVMLKHAQPLEHTP